jgi:hypothetical protein
MWLVIVGLLSLGFGVLALIGLFAVIKELFCDSPPDANVADASASGRHGVGGDGSARRCVVTR